MNLAKAVSREPEDAWIGEVFLTIVGSLVAFALWGWALAFSIEGLVAALGGDLPAYAIPIWLVAVLGFPTAAFWGGWLVHRRAHPPVPTRLYVLAVSFGLTAWAVVIAAVLVICLFVALIMGQGVPPF